MREAEFGEWLQSQDYDTETIATQISRAKRLDQTYGDLDLLHPDGGLVQLERELIYSKDDERAGNPNPARFVIDGSIYNSLASYRKTIDYYRQFADAELGTPERKEQLEALDLLGQDQIEATMNDCDTVGVDAFLKLYRYGRPTNWALRSTSATKYPAKATVGVALGKLPGSRSLRASEFFGGFGEQQAFNRLRELGYKVVNNDGADQTSKGIGREAVELALDEFDALGQATFLAKYERGVRGTRYWLMRGVVMYPSKAIANAAYERLHGARGAYGGTEARKQIAKLGYRIVDKESRQVETANSVALMRTHNSTPPTNVILYGPPGTGKTYATASEAVRLCDGIPPSDRDDLMARYEELRGEKRIGFVTFHQSYDYETFVEGLRPETADHNGGAGFRLEAKPGIFREISALADHARLHPPGPAAAKVETGLADQRFWKMGQGAIGSEDEVYEAAIQGSYITLGWGGAVDWGPSRFSTPDAIRTEWLREKPDDATPSNWTQTHTFRSEMQVGDIVIVPYGNSAFRAIAEVVGEYYFETAADGYYAHRRKVRWLLKLDEPLPLDTIVEGNFTMRTLYPLAPKRVNHAALARLLASDHTVSTITEVSVEPDQFVLIIDEINRANISKVFGELITLIEPDKRLGMPNAISLRLPYSKHEFGVPANLHIIGTMNTADRSIALLDTALRRRFQFREVAPDPSRLPKHADGVPLRRVLETMNDRIEYLIDRDHRIGHAFFMGGGGASRTAIDATMRNKVIPLLQEYFFDDWSRLAAVLGEMPDKGGNFLECRMLTDPTGSGGEPRQSWRVSEEFAPDAYERLLGRKEASAT